MKISQKTQYHCELCNAVYGTAKEALACEKRPITQDKGANVGDIVLIIQGQSRGKKATITKLWVYDKAWGHYAYDRYWHTVGAFADIMDSSFSRQLTFDDYELMESSK